MILAIVGAVIGSRLGRRWGERLGAAVEAEIARQVAEQQRPDSSWPPRRQSVSVRERPAARPNRHRPSPRRSRRSRRLSSELLVPARGRAGTVELDHPDRAEHGKEAT
jgi:hypothetical protein